MVIENNENQLIFYAECLAHKHKSPCLRCGILFDNDYHTCPKSYCSACRLIRNKEISQKAMNKYHKTNKGKNTIKKYKASSKGKQAQHQAYKTYYSTPKGYEVFKQGRSRRDLKLM